MASAQKIAAITFIHIESELRIVHISVCWPLWSSCLVLYCITGAGNLITRIKRKRYIMTSNNLSIDLHIDTHTHTHISELAGRAIFFFGQLNEWRPIFEAYLKLNTQNHCNIENKTNNYAYLCSLMWSALRSILFAFFGQANRCMRFMVEFIAIGHENLLNRFFLVCCWCLCVRFSFVHTNHDVANSKSTKSSHTMWFFHIYIYIHFIKSNGILWFSCNSIYCLQSFFLSTDSVHSDCLFGLFVFIFICRLSAQKQNKKQLNA